MKKSNYVTVNTDSTIESVNLSTINLPLEGYPLLLIMENLLKLNLKVMSGAVYVFVDFSL